MEGKRINKTQEKKEINKKKKHAMHVNQVITKLKNVTHRKISLLVIESTDKEIKSYNID